VTVDGSGSTWSTGTYSLYVGRYGSGTFNITDGADVTSGIGYIGYFSGSEGTVTVDGYGSTWNTGSGNIYTGLTGTGTLNISNDAQVTTTGTLNIGDDGTVNLSGGKLSAANLTGSADTLNFTGGELEITTGGITISGSDPLGSYLSMGSGQILDIAGSTTVKAASTLNVSSGTVTSGDLQNDGYLTLGNGGSITTATGLINSSYMNMSGGTIGGAGKLTNDYGASFYAKGTVNTALDNYGTINLDDVLTVAGAMDNYGLVSIYTSEMLRQNGGLDNYGTVDLDGGSITGSGAITNRPGGIIRGGSAIGSQLTNDGGLIHADGYSTLLISDMGGGNINGGEMRVDNDAGINVLTPFSNAGTVILNGSDATFSGGTITNTGTISGQGWASNSVTNNGTVRSSGGKLTLAGSGFTNSGTGRIEALADSTVFVTQGLANNQGDITLLGGVFDNGNQTIENSGSITGYGTFRSGGLTNIETGHIGIGLGDFEIIGAVVNNGNVYIESGSTAVFYDDVSGSGSFTGTGTTMFLGSLSPGSSPGIMSFEGNVALGSAAVLEIELAGTLPGDYDVIDVAGDLTLAGILDVVLIDSFEPDFGDTFDILDFNPANLFGTFDTINLPELSGTLAWDALPLYTTGEISVVPEPATIGLLGLGSLALLRKRRRV
jgi:T5SS/PEP-CTERM-associated repeat protein